jgi:hypothetical protein
VDKVWILCIRPRTVRVMTADCPTYQVLDCPSQQSRLFELTGREPSTDPTRTVHDRQITRAEAVILSLSTLVSFSLTLHTPKVILVVCELTVNRNCARSVREIVWSSSTMSSSRYFKISWNLSNLFKFGDS